MEYISLFSSGGVGCYGFKMEGFDCIATSELIERRLNIQKINNKVKYESGYILGDITQEDIKKELFDAITFYKDKEKIQDVDVIIFTPPCQGMSVANHKKNDGTIIKNSLVVESLEIVEKIKPKFFISENVRSFMNTKCIDNNKEKKIKEAFHDWLSEDYIYEDRILNFKDYGANSSRTRTLVIGVRKDISHISPEMLFPSKENAKSLKETIGYLPSLTVMGEIDSEDIYHNFRSYREDMRNWVHNLKEGESAFDNEDISKRPHRIIDGKIVPNVKKNGSKYTRQYWNKPGPCIHTRNDILASQNTIHPSDDRVFSIRELMIMMNIPKSFKWSECSEKELNSLSLENKKKYLKKNEINIRQCIGEAVPPIIMQKIAHNIKKLISREISSDKQIKKFIEYNKLVNRNDVLNYVRKNPDNLSIYDLSRISELINTNRSKTAAYYTDISTLDIIKDHLPTIKNKIIRILEPSAGVGNFLDIIIEKYSSICDKLIIDLNDIDLKSIELIKELNKYRNIPENVEINYYNEDFLNYNFDSNYDLIIGNPPFLKLSKKTGLEKYSKKFSDNVTKNISGFFLQNALKHSDNIVLIMPKYFLNNTDFQKTRDIVKSNKISEIIDFGENGFKGVLIETIALVINTKEPINLTTAYSVTKKLININKQEVLTNNQFPSWVIYRNDFFENVAKKMNFDIFSVFRDRQITNKILKQEGDIRVIKSRNISREKLTVVNIENYDSYIDFNDLKELSVYKYLNKDDVYLCPNMTYYPRVILKPKNTVVNGSVAILENKKNIEITDNQLKFFASDTFEKFYRIARNYSTRTLNIDVNSVVFFGLIRDD